MVKLRVKKKKSAKDLFDNVFAMFSSDFLYLSIYCGYKSVRFKWIPTTYAFIKKQTKGTLAVI